MSDHISYSVLRRNRLARVATFLVVSAAISLAPAQQRKKNQPSPPKSQPSGQSNQPAPPKNQPSEKTSAAFTNLKPLQEKQDWAGMLAILDGIPITPGSYDEALIMDMKGKLYAQLNQISKALAPWERAVELSDLHGYFPEKTVMETVSYLAQLYGGEAFSSKVPAQQQELFTKAIKYFKRYIEKTPKPTPEMMMYYASVLHSKASADPNKVDQALLNEARAVVEKGLMTSIKPKEGFYQLLLALQQQQNDMAGSTEILELILKSSPTKKDYWQMLMAMYLQLGEKAREKGDATLAREYLVRAIVTCERAQGLGHMQTTKDNMNLVSLYLMANQFTKGTELLYNGMKSGKIESEPNNWRVLGRYYLEADQNLQAIAVLKEAAKLFPKNSEIEVQLAQIYLQMEKPREALGHAKTAIAKNNFESTKPFAVHYLVAYTAYDLGEIDEAQKAIAVAETFPEASKDPQFPKLKGVITEAVTERENRAKDKEKDSKNAAKKNA